MLYFPQLATGATVQFPLARRLSRRTIMNRTPDGTLVKLDDPSAASISWMLRYQGLCEAERAQIETLFEDTEGPLRTFRFSRSMRKSAEVERGPDQAYLAKGRGAADHGWCRRRRRD